ncbi:hypothetical protein SLH46_03975 [Draconibacterium sp. IB214405]|uniref:hypothetical protein n=1 Tax=Draconibacterium sp. IB214405 TaxID=3097352 RepID=UPI002A0BDB2D|nr:hypothetical protein [Draconibacterium sp. IB214405]MDX8338329.1 hypothetical protein [Draconibacterium sp. IB214405]
MGYNGLGMQRWISTMKPRKYLGKRSKPDGGGGAPSAGPEVSSYYHIKKRNFSVLKSKTYTESYKKQLRSKLAEDKRNSNWKIVISIAIGLVIILLLFVYFNDRLNLL